MAGDLEVWKANDAGTVYGDMLTPELLRRSPHGQKVLDAIRAQDKTEGAVTVEGRTYTFRGAYHAPKSELGGEG